MNECPFECPFCNEALEGEDLVFEFRWGDVSSYYYNRNQIPEPKNEYRDRVFYVTFGYDSPSRRPMLRTMDPVVNPDKHPRLSDPLCFSEHTGWDQVKSLLGEKKVFEVECDDDCRTLPTVAKILPLIKHNKRLKRPDAEGVSTGIFCPHCEQQLNPAVLRAEKEMRIVLVGRPGNGKTVYATQVISELMVGRLTQSFHIDAANLSVLEHYNNNKKLLHPFGGGFVRANNPGVVQEPYVYLMSNGKSSIRLIIQDIAGEDTADRTKYSNAVRKADLILFFVDPWNIKGVRDVHIDNNDPSNAIVERFTHGQYDDLNGVFQQMMNSIDRESTNKSDQLAGVMLVKGDYLVPPMLAGDQQPECKMMQQSIPLNNPEEMEFSLGLRSSFIRQYLHEWDSTCSFAREVESKYKAHNVRYFVSSALGQSTHLRHVQPEASVSDNGDPDDPNAQFNVSSAEPSPSGPDNWDYDEQVLESAARPEHVLDPIFWCLKRRGFRF